MINFLVLISLLIPSICNMGEKYHACDDSSVPAGSCVVNQDFNTWFGNFNQTWSCKCYQGGCYVPISTSCQIWVFQTKYVLPCRAGMSCHWCLTTGTYEDVCWAEMACDLVDPNIPCVTETMCVPVLHKQYLYFDEVDHAYPDCCCYICSLVQSLSII